MRSRSAFCDLASRRLPEQLLSRTSFARGGSRRSVEVHLTAVCRWNGERRRRHADRPGTAYRSRTRMRLVFSWACSAGSSRGDSVADRVRRNWSSSPGVTGKKPRPVGRRLVNTTDRCAAEARNPEVAPVIGGHPIGYPVRMLDSDGAVSCCRPGRCRRRSRRRRHPGWPSR